METHKVLNKSITMPNGETIDIKYWTDPKTVYVAAYDAKSKQVSASIYDAEVDLADGFNAALHQTLIDALVLTIESDLKINPQLHYRP